VSTVRLSQVAVLIAALAALSGCTEHGRLADDEHDRLADVERELAPARAEKAADCLEGGSFGIDYPEYVCTYYVPGNQAELTLELARSLRELGFVAKCDWDDGSVEIQAGRDTLDVYVDISQRGSMLGFSESGEPLDVYAPDDAHVPSWARAIPAGTVIVRINVSDYGEYRWPDEFAPDCNRTFLAARDESPDGA
jgi:hypothetical protein